MCARSRYHELLRLRPIKNALRRNRALVRAYFGFRYLRRDPYGSNRPKELEKIEQAFRLLHGLSVRNALEIGCGEGRFSGYVAGMADRVLAIDISDIAIRRARKKAAHLTNVTFKRADLLTTPLENRSYDLIVCSEVLYYIDLSQLDTAIRKIIGVLRPQGRLLLVHHKSSGDDSSGGMDKQFGARTIHEAFNGCPELLVKADISEQDYRIGLLQRL